MNKLRRLSKLGDSPTSPMSQCPAAAEQAHPLGPAISASVLPMGRPAEAKGQPLLDEDHVLDVMVSGRSKDGGVRLDVKRNASPLGVERGAAADAVSGDHARPSVSEDTLRIGDSKTAEMAVEAHRVYHEEVEQDPSRGHEAEGDRPPVPRLAIVIMVAGTRGDVQPFIAFALRLMEYGHRIRLATHEHHRKFVAGFNVEFFPLGGDPEVLSDFIVESRGIVPRSIKSGRDNIEQVKLIVSSTYAAATEPDPKGNGEPFTAQAIIANPPTYGHLHVAEKMSIPCHIFFTMPWSPTRAFPSPLARFDSIADPGTLAGMRNYVSYVAVEDAVYLGLRGIIRKFRKQLGLPKLRAGEGTNPSHLIDYHKVPFGYCWSRSLVPKPADWESHIDVCGFFILSEGKRNSYNPPEDLRKFLDSGPAPVYFGFGSMRVEDGAGLTKIIVAASERSGHRIVLSSGWANLGKDIDLPSHVVVVDEAPHDWLLPKCAAAVHHGGAGTTAAGLSAACPTTVVYFFGDQPFWGSACHRRGVGPSPISIDSLTVDKLVAALECMDDPAVREKAQEISEQLAKDDGTGAGMAAFHRHLPVEALRGQPVLWDLAHPPQRGLARQVMANCVRIAIRIPARASITGTQHAIGRGRKAASFCLGRTTHAIDGDEPSIGAVFDGCQSGGRAVAGDEWSNEVTPVEVERSMRGVSLSGHQLADNPVIPQVAAAVAAASHMPGGGELALSSDTDTDSDEPGGGRWLSYRMTSP